MHKSSNSIFLTIFFRCPILLCVLILFACATPAEHFAAVAKRSGFTEVTLNSGEFSHRVFRNELTYQAKSTGILHVYLDGDGSPWRYRQWISEDPTSKNPMILELMKQDSHPSILLGRPCYHGLNKSTRCDPKYWTSHRYSEAVVNSMAAALKLWLKNSDDRQIVLIGFSGGGALAVLIAPKIDRVTTVVTIAANLDVDAWSKYHNYPVLSDSLNPAKLLIKPNRYKQIHLAGLKDRTVPSALIKSYAEKQPNSRFIGYPNFDHHCCWVKKWPEILSLF